MYELEYLESKIVEHCNYRCVACAGFGNIANKEVYDIEQFDMDLKRIAELFHRVKRFHILGGEPLLNKNINSYIEIARKYLISTEIYLITNGTLLTSMDDSFFETVCNNNIKIHISHYPEMKDMKLIGDAQVLLKEKEVKYEVIDTKIFSVSLLLEDNKYDINETFSVCNSYMNCINLYNGRIYKCPRPMSLKHYDRMFNTNYANLKDGIDINSYNITGGDILEYLCKPIETCKHCTPERGYLKWKQCKVSKYDWQLSDKNDKLINTVKNNDHLEDIFDNMQLLIISFEKSTNKLDFSQESFEYINSLKGEEIYIWLHDIRCINYCDIFNLIAKENNINVVGIVARTQKLANSLFNVRICSRNDLKDAKKILVFASGLKGIISARNEISYILERKN